MHGGLRIQRRVQVVAQGGGQGGLIALAGRDLIQGRGVIAAGGGEQLGQTPRLGLQPAQPVLGGAGRGAGLLLGAGQIAAPGLGRLDGGTGLGQPGLRGLHPGTGLVQFRRLQRAQSLQLTKRLVPLATGAGQAGLGIATPRGLGGGAGLDGGQGPGPTLHLAVRLGPRGLGPGQGRVQLGPPARRGLHLGLQRGQGIVEAAQFVPGVVQQRGLAVHVGGDTGALRGQALDLGAGRLLGQIQTVALQGGAVQQGRGDRVLLPRRLHRLLGRQGGGLGPRRCRGGLGHGPVGLGQLGAGQIVSQSRVVPAHPQQGRLQGADLGADLLVFLGLPRLAFQPGQGGLDLAADVVQPLQIGLGGAQAKLGLMPTGVQAGDAARLLENAAAVLGLGGDQLADLALPDQRRGVCPRRGVREQKLHVAGPHLLAVDAVGRALPPVDAARHLDHGGIGERGRGLPLGVVDRQEHFGPVAWRAVAGAGEDDVLHALTAHGLGRVGPHDPAQPLQHIGLAAAVGTDHARQAGLDEDLRRFDEGLETHQSQPLELHGVAVSAPSRMRPWHRPDPPYLASSASIMADRPSSERSVTCLPLTKKVGVADTPWAWASRMRASIALIAASSVTQAR